MNAHTLHIGTNYLGTSSELAGCLNDAKDLCALCKPNAASATLLLGKKADREGIVKAVRKVLHRLEPGDIAFISFSGHGTQEPDEDGDEASGYDQAIVCEGFELIYDDEMGPALDDRDKDTWVVALLDCCHSQTMHRGLSMPFLRRKSIPLSKCKRRTRDRVDAPRALWKAGSINGCEEGSYSYDGEFNGRPNGALTYYTIQAAKALKGKRPTFNELFRKIGGRGGALPTEDYPQQPTKMGSKGNFARRIPFL